MRKFTRPLTAAAIATLMGGLSMAAAEAQPMREGPSDGRGPMMRAAHHGPGHGGQFGDPAEHLKRLKEEIGITPAQTAAWDTYAKVVQDNAEKMRALRPDGSRHRFMEMSTQERLDTLTKARDAREQAMAQVKAAADALLPTLTDTQKVRALMSLPGLAPPHMMMRQHAMRHDGPHGGPRAN